MIVAYFDESGTHGDSCAMVMAGYLGKESAWLKFEETWRKLLEQYPEVSPVHAQRLIPRSGCYRSWPSEKYNQFVASLLQLISPDLHGVAAIVDRADYKRAKKEGILGFSPKDSAYGLCFRVCWMKARPIMQDFYPGERLSFVLEGGHGNAGAAMEIVAELKPEWTNPPLGDCSFAAKKDYGALQAADLIAHCVWRNASASSEHSVCRTLLSNSNLQTLRISWEELIQIATVTAAFGLHRKPRNNRRVEPSENLGKEKR